jgi:hypothetical protein|tara:strand:+ start:2293 stop:2541 length:249 start_codon:yes stop_codon:yes gene_type:complete
MTPIIDDLNRLEKKELLGTYVTNKRIKSQIDNLMHQMAVLECNTGIDTTEKERKQTLKEQLVLLKKIKELDPVKYDVLKKVY